MIIIETLNGPDFYFVDFVSFDNSVADTYTCMFGFNHGQRFTSLSSGPTIERSCSSNVQTLASTLFHIFILTRLFSRDAKCNTYQENVATNVVSLYRNVDFGLFQIRRPNQAQTL